MNKKEKIKIVGDLTDKLTISKNIYFTDISGLNAEQTSSLRRMCFDKGVAVSVVKNTLLKKAMDACDKDFSNFDDLLQDTHLMHNYTFSFLFYVFLDNALFSIILQYWHWYYLFML